MKSLAVVLVLFCATALAQTRPQLKTGAQSSQTQLKMMVSSTDLEVTWLPNGAINPQVLASFPPRIQALYSAVAALPIYDLTQMRTPQDLLVTLTEVDRLNSTVQTAIVSLAASPRTFPVVYIQRLPLFVFSLIRPASLRTIGSSFTAAQRTALCARLVREHLDTETSAAIVAGVDCVPTFVTLGLGKNLRRDIAYAIVKGVKMRTPLANWNAATWTSMLELAQGLDAEDIPLIPTAVILVNIPKFTMILPKLDPRLRMEIVQRCVSAMGGHGAVTGPRLRLMIPFFRFMRPSDFRKFPKALMPLVARTMSRLKFEDANQQREIADMLREQQGEPKKWNLTQFKEAGALLMSREYSMKQVNVSVLKDAIEELGQDARTAKEAAPIMERIMQDPTLQHAANWTVVHLRKAKHLLKGMSVSFLRQLNGTRLVQILKDIKDVELSNALRRALWDKVKPHLPKRLFLMNSTEIADLKAVLRGMKGDEMNRFNGSHLADALGELGDGVKLGRGLQQSCMNRMNNQLSGGVRGAIGKLGSFASRVPASLMKNATDAVLGVSGDGQLNTDCEEDQCKVLFERIKKSKGNVSDPSFTPKRIRNYGKAILGMSEDDVKKLPKGRVLMTVVDQVCQFAKRNSVPNALLQALALKIKAVVNMTEPNVTQRVSHTDLLQSSCLAKFFSEQELLSFGKKHCRTIVNELSSIPMDDIDPKQMKALFRYSLSCMNKSSSGAVITTEVMEKAGNAICGLEASHLSKLNRTVFFNFVARLGCRCNFDETMRRAIAEKFIQQYSVVLSAPRNTTKVPRLGCLLNTLTASELSQIPSDVLMDMCQDVAENADKLREIRKSRAKKGQKADISESDKTLYKAGLKRVMDACTTARQSASSGGGGVGRKRRQTASLTCTQLMAMGSAVTSVTTSQIQALSDTEFLNCADFLGNETEWTSAQKTELANVAQRATTWGTPNTWSSSNLQDAGTIAQGLTDTQIGTLTLTSMDGISDLGDYDGWSSSQLTNGFAKWLADYKSGSASSVNQTEMISIGHFICGATSSHISSIPAAEYGGAASSIGQLDSCTSTLSHWATHAVTYFGAVSTWSASDVSTVGVVVGGLSSSSLASFTASHIQSLSVTVIPNLPGSTLASLSVTQLGYMSSAQAQAVTAAQQASLSSAQLLVLQNLGATMYTTSGSITLVPCVTLLFAAFLAKLL